MKRTARGLDSLTCNSDPYTHSRLKRRPFLSALLLCFATLLTLTGPALADDDDDDDDVLVLGVMGDSISDEYKAPNGGPFLGYEGYEWGSVLIHTRDVSFGRYRKRETEFGQPKGYRYNFALKGQATQETNNTFEFFGLFPGIGDSGQSFADQARDLARAFARKRIDAAVIQGGANDIFIYGFLPGSYDPDDEDFIAYRQGIIDAYANALDTPVRRRGTLADQKVIVATIPVFGPPDQQAGIESINEGIRAVAAARGVPTFSTSDSLIEKIDFSDFTVVVGEYRIPLGSVASSDDLVPPGDPASVDDEQCGFSNGLGTGIGPAFGEPGCPTVAYQLNLTQDDEVHATTISAALSANDVVKAMNSAFGFGIKPLSDKEILDLALGRRKGGDDDDDDDDDDDEKDDD